MTRLLCGEKQFRDLELSGVLYFMHTGDGFGWAIAAAAMIGNVGKEDKKRGEILILNFDL